MKKKANFFTFDIFIKAIIDAMVKLNPLNQLKNPVMFVVFIGACFTTFIVIKDVIIINHFSNFNFQITIWLWFTVLFANFAELSASTDIPGLKSESCNTT